MKLDLTAMTDELLRKSIQRHMRREENKNKSDVINPENPMSPYAPQRSPKIRNITDMMNKKWYDAVYTQNYAPIPAGYLNHQYVKAGPRGREQLIDFGQVAPIYTATKGTEQAYGALTIAGMLDLLDQNDDFTLVHPSDMIEIRSVCQNYFDIVLKKTKSQVGIAYGEKIKAFIVLLDDRISKLPGEHRELSYDDLLKLMGM